MKPDIHPKYYPNARVMCACGHTWTTGSTLPEIRVDVCYHDVPVTIVGVFATLPSAGEAVNEVMRAAGMTATVATAVTDPAELVAVRTYVVV